MEYNNGYLLWIVDKISRGIPHGLSKNIKFASVVIFNIYAITQNVVVNII